MAGLTRVTSWLIKIKLGIVGTISRYLSEKLSESISLKDFGAKGDGSTDDTTAFKAAFAWAASQPRGATLLIPDGSYNLREEIVWDGSSQIFLVAENSGGATLSWVVGATSCGLRGGTNTPIKRFSAYGVTLTTSTVTPAPAIKVVFDKSSPKSLILQEVSAYGGAVGGVASNGYWGGGMCQATDPVYPIYEHCYFFGIGGPETVAKSNLINSGFLIECTGGVFFNNYRNCFVNNVNSAIWFRTTSTPGIEGSFVESCNFNGVNIGVQYEGQDSGNAGYYPPQLFINNSQIEYLQRAVSVRKAGKVSVRGNLLYADPSNDVALTHILLTDVESAIITDNYMETRPVHTQADGVVVVGNSTNIQVRDNHIKIPANKFAVVFGGTSSNCVQANNLVLGGKEYSNSSSNSATNTPEAYLINNEESINVGKTIIKMGSRVVTVGAGGSFTLNFVRSFPTSFTTAVVCSGDTAATTNNISIGTGNQAGLACTALGVPSGTVIRINYYATGR